MTIDIHRWNLWTYPLHELSLEGAEGERKDLAHRLLINEAELKLDAGAANWIIWGTETAKRAFERLQGYQS